MNREDIIRLAMEVGFAHYGEDTGEYRIPTPAFHSRLERFAALVAAAEREACANIVMAEQATPHGLAYCEAAIRSRGEVKP